MTTTARNAITLTASLARASGQDAANRQMRKANRTKWSRADYNLAVSTTNRLMLQVPFEHGGLGGIELPVAHVEDLGLTIADVIASGNRVAGHNGGPAIAA